MERRTIIVMLLIAAACSDGGGGAAESEPRTAGPVRADAVLDGFAHLPRLRLGVSSGQVSSYDRGGGNADFGMVANANNTLYEEDGRYVVFDRTGPGILTRWWMTDFRAGEPDAEINDVALEFVFDRDPEPLLSTTIGEFFSGALAELPAPLAANPAISSGGYIAYPNFYYAGRLKVRVGRHLNYYQMNYLDLAPDSAPCTCETGADPRAGEAAAALEGPLLAPFNSAFVDPAHYVLDPGERTNLFVDEEAGQVTRLDLEFRDSDDSILRGVWLHATFDGAAEPQISLPVGFLFGAPEGGECNSAVARWDPDERKGRFFLPMPYDHSVKLELENRSANPVEALGSLAFDNAEDAWDQPAGHLHAVYRSEELSEDERRDFVLLETEGWGHIVGTVMVKGCRGLCVALLDPGGHLEGDERILIDGSRMPFHHGTGAEDYFNSGFYYMNGPYSMPTHGHTAYVATPDADGIGERYAVYRWHLFDPIPFMRDIRFSIEHGPINNMPVRFDSAVFYYSRSEPVGEWMDALDVGDEASEAAHEYAGEGERWVRNHAFPGEDETAIEADGRSDSAPIRFQMELPKENRGVRLRRMFDSTERGQRAVVMVNGERAGVWYNADGNALRPWAESDFEIDARLTAGKSRLEIEIVPEGEVLWTATEYRLMVLRP